MLSEIYAVLAIIAVGCICVSYCRLYRLDKMVLVYRRLSDAIIREHHVTYTHDIGAWMSILELETWLKEKQKTGEVKIIAIKTDISYRIKFRR